MSEENLSRGLTRRKFLKSAGLIAGIAALAPLPYAQKQFIHLDSLDSKSRTKIGVMVPKSSIFPSLGDSFTRGMRLFFDQHRIQRGGTNFELVAEDVGFGPGSMAATSQKLIGENRVDIVAGVMNSDAVPHVRKTFDNARTPLIVTGLGENVVRPADKSPFIFYNTFNYWQSNWAAGAWAAGNVGKTAVVAASFYDSGYDALYAFQNGFESAGGELLQIVTTGVPSEDKSLYQSLSEIETANPDFVYAFYCGSEAADFMRAYASSKLAGTVPLMASGFLVDDDILPHHGDAAIGVKSALPWSNTLRLSDNGDFLSSYIGRTGKAPNAFSVLGYDTAQMIHQAVQYNGGHIRKPSDLVNGLASADFNSPRGRLRMNYQTQSLDSPIYLREVQGAGGSLSNVVIDELKTSPALDENILADLAGPKTGWLNAYLSV